MDNTVIYASVMYLLAYRLSVLILGGISIYFGYRLFLEGVSGENIKNTEMEAEIHSLKLKLNSAAPGVFFSLFGAAIIISILFKSPPEIIQSVNSNENSNHVVSEYTARGDLSPRASGAAQVPSGLSQLETVVNDIHHIIWDVYHGESLGLAKKIVDIEPVNPDYLDTLALLYFVEDSYDNAVQYQQLAVENAMKLNISGNKLIKFQRKLEVYRKFSSDF